MWNETQWKLNYNVKQSSVKATAMWNFENIALKRAEQNPNVKMSATV